MDAFFASVEQRDRPELRGRPLIVGGDGRRGVVAAASYEARRFGVHSAMPAGRARRLCPQAVFVAPRHAHYREVSAGIFAIFRRHAERVEGLSLDEAFLDMSGHPWPEAVARARLIKRQVSIEHGLTVSIGIGPNKLVAKLASAWDKPDGLTIVDESRVHEFLDPLPVRRLPGVGPSTGARLHDAGILTVGQLRRAPVGWLEPALGRQAAHFRRRAAGIDEREVAAGRTRRSISQESTFGDDLHRFEDIAAIIEAQAEACARRLVGRGLWARSVQIKLRSGGFSTLTRSSTLEGYTRSAATIATAALALAEAWAGYQTRLGVRLIGVGVSGLADNPDPASLLRGEVE